MYPHGFLKEHSSVLLWVMRFLDCLVLLSSYGIAYLIVFGTRPLPAHYQIAAIFSVLLLLLVFQVYALYRAWRGIDYAQEFSSIVLGWSTVFALLVFLSVITKTSASFSRAWLIMWFTFGGIALLAMRYAIRETLKLLRSRGYNLRHVVIIGSGDVGQHVLDRIIHTPDTGFNILAYFSDNSAQFNTIDEIEVGPLSEAKGFVSTSSVDQVWLAMPLNDMQRIESILDDLQYATCDIRLVPDIFSFRLINHSVSSIAGMPVINLSVTPMEGVNRWIKALEDKLLSTLILVLISPLFIVIALFLLITDPGPLFYKQRRLSWNGREFTMYKFRTMPVDVELDSGAVWATPDENRATPLGSFLRRTSLDELPQFWNVIKGDMSIVGPRPERPIFVERFKNEIPSYMQKHMVKAGITGWAQVNGWRGDTDLQKRIEYDLYYIDNWSLWLDLKIIFQTVFKGFVSKNAY